MKSLYKSILIILLILLVGGLIFYFINDNDELYPVTEDSLNFLKEYQELNGKINNNNQKEYFSIKMPENAPVRYSSYEEIFEIIEDGTGIIYFGFPECPWCRNVVPVLINSAIEYGVKDNIYYLNNREDRNTLSLNNKGEVVTDKEASNDYLKLIEVLKKYLPSYNGLNDEDIKRLYFPTILFVKNGRVIGLEQTLPSYSERVSGDGYLPMTENEIKELSNIYKDYYQKIET